MNRPSRASQLLVALLLMLAATSCRTETSSEEDTDPVVTSWPIFRGDYALSGTTPVSLPNRPVLLWSHASDSRTVSSPVLQNGQVYWTDRRGLITGLDPEGQVIFTHALETATEASLLLNDTMAYIGTIGGFMHALSLKSNRLLWSFESRGQVMGSANILSVNDTSYLLFGSYDYSFYCLDAHTGTLIRSFESEYYLNGTAAISGQDIAFGGCDAFVRVVDMHSGTDKMNTELDVYIPSSPVFSNDHLIVGDYNGTIYRIGAEDGQTTRLFSPEAENGSYVAIPAVNDEYIVFTSDDQKIYCLDNASGTLRWSYLLGDKCESSPVIAGGQILICTRNGRIFILDAATGTSLWSYDTGEVITASPAVISGRFYVLTNRGTLFCFGNSPGK